MAHHISHENSARARVRVRARACARVRARVRVQRQRAVRVVKHALITIHKQARKDNVNRQCLTWSPEFQLINTWREEGESVRAHNGTLISFHLSY